jgi:hypothetical protein
MNCGPIFTCRSRKKRERMAVPRKDKLPVCPHCGQRMVRRYGVDLPPQAALIFDMIENSKTRGVPAEALAWTFFANKSAAAGRRLVYVHVFQINKFLQATPVRITIKPPIDNFAKRGRAPGYYVVKRRRGAAGHMRVAA